MRQVFTSERRPACSSVGRCHGVLWRIVLAYFVESVHKKNMMMVKPMRPEGTTCSDMLRIKHILTFFSFYPKKYVLCDVLCMGFIISVV